MHNTRQGHHNRMLAILFFMSIIFQYGVYTVNSNIVRRIDPEVTMNTSQIVSYHGYPSEDHDVTTSDGYILSVQRIPGPRHSANTTSGRPVVLLWHGLLYCSSCWVENLPNESFGFILADAGYDVWLGNSRGNTYGLRHKTLTPDQDAFWAFSFDEFAIYDLPETIDYILSVTGESAVAFVGHSEGNEIMFASRAANFVPKEKVNFLAALGPGAYVQHCKSPLKFLLQMPPQTLVDRFGKQAYSPHSDFITWIGKEFCSRPLPDFVCENIIFLFGGYDFKNLNQSRIPVYIGHTPAGTSVQNMVHYSQMQAPRAGTFQMFDYGSEENMKKYNQTTPPKYDLANFDLPVALFVGTNDWLTVPEDVEKLASELHTVVLNKVIPDYEHLDYVWAVNAPKTVYTDIMKLLKTYS